MKYLQDYFTPLNFKFTTWLSKILWVFRVESFSVYLFRSPSYFDYFLSYYHVIHSSVFGTPLNILFRVPKIFLYSGL